MPALHPQLAQEVAARYLKELDRHGAGALRVTDKMPTNFLYLGMIAVLFPNARVVHCRRNPLDVCLSCYFTNFTNRISFASDLLHLGEYYRMYARLMEHWRDVLPSEILEVDYARIVDEPEPVIRGLVEYCGLEWDPNCLESHKSGRAVRTPSSVQVREPIHRRAIDRWKSYQQHLGPLRNALGIK
jgi:hypothetical protein